MTRLIHYKPSVIAKLGIGQRDIENYSHFGNIFGGNITMFDRTGSIKSPINSEILFPIPEIPSTFNKPYSQICDERAIEFLNRADRLNVPLRVFYSGGIDSTVVMVALLRNATEQQRKNIIVFLTRESINENPVFYREHIQHKLTVESSAIFPYLMNTQSMLIGGQNNDQLFGSDLMRKMITTFGPDVMHLPYNRDIFNKLFMGSKPNPNATIIWLDLLERSASTAPIQVKTNVQFLWWLNFTLKWQYVFVTLITMASKSNQELIDSNFMHNYYDQFFTSDDFQIWSMTNLDQKIGETWTSYKWVAKDYIYDFTKDSDYRDNKTKIGSLANLIVNQPSMAFIDSDINIFDEIEFEKIYVPNNDFT